MPSNKISFMRKNVLELPEIRAEAKFSAMDRSAGHRLMTHDERLRRVIMNFRQIVSSARGHFQLVQEQCGVSGAQLWALWEVSRRPGIKVGELAGMMSIHQSTASNLVEKLESKALFRRKRSGHDQRVVQLFVTARGVSVLKRAPAPMRGVLGDALDQLPSAALQKLEEALASVLERIELRDNRAAKRPLSDLIT